MRSAPVAAPGHAPSSTETPFRNRPLPGAREVAARKTVTRTEDIRAAIAEAYKARTGHTATPELLDVLTAHVSHETALGTRMFNFNFGGIKGQSPAGETARYMTREVTPAGEEVRLSQPFRAYSSLQAGAADYVDLMSSRFPEAFSAAQAGDPRAFSAALKRRGYYTASEESYAAAMNRLVASPAAIGREEGAAPARRRVSTRGISLHPGPVEDRSSTEQVAAAREIDAQQLLTTVALARVLDSLSASEVRLGEPPSDPQDR